MNTVPCILCIGGHDPTGGAGIQADIETVSALGGRAMTLVTALTTQDSHDIVAIQAVDPAPFESRLDCLTGDIRPDADKIGMIGSSALIAVMHGFLKDFDGPVVLDPVLAAGGGFDLDETGLREAITVQLLPLSMLTTPNHAEARRLTGRQEPEEAALALLRSGAGAVLLTGADEAGEREVNNRLFTADRPPRTFRWPRLPHSYHGSGCTLAAACVTRLALGDDLETAVAAAQAYTWDTLARAERPGGGQWMPERRA